VSAESDAALVSFAKRFGPLALFQIGSGASASVGPNPERLHLRRKHQSDVHRERIEWWRQYQAQFRTILNLAAHYRDPTAPPRQVFTELEGLGVRPFREKTSFDRWEAEALPDLAGIVVVLHMRTLTRLCGICPALQIKLNEPAGNQGVDLVFQDSSSGWV